MGKSTATRRSATHKPATKRRRFRNDDLVAVDLFSGFGGLTHGIEMAGFTTIMAANHNPYKVEVHEANHPQAEHWIADLVDPGAADYHSARDLPAADLLVAGVSSYLVQAGETAGQPLGCVSFK
ncbi:DNA cytosine methyltransferase [Kitasatospora sp. NPDC085895]|uniref:DNA cytosine methyltransferase n=1 Tax=Kitasatospora sp. NPDC085895 TaxID=3155057 RepID=UPI00344FB32C